MQLACLLVDECDRGGLGERRSRAPRRRSTAAVPRRPPRPRGPRRPPPLAAALRSRGWVRVRGAQVQDGLQLERREAGVALEHQRRDARDVRSRERVAGRTVPCRHPATATSRSTPRAKNSTGGSALAWNSNGSSPSWLPTERTDANRQGKLATAMLFALATSATRANQALSASSRSAAATWLLRVERLRLTTSKPWSTAHSRPGHQRRPTARHRRPQHAHAVQFAVGRDRAHDAGARRAVTRDVTVLVGDDRVRPHRRSRPRSPTPAHRRAGARLLRRCRRCRRSPHDRWRPPTPIRGRSTWASPRAGSGRSRRSRDSRPAGSRDRASSPSRGRRPPPPRWAERRAPTPPTGRGRRS